jgi:cell shape-determining protein MreC
MSVERDWQKYLLNEEVERDIFMYIQALQEAISFFKPRSMKENRRLNLVRNNLREIKRHARRMENKVSVLEEKLNILEEQLNENKES